VILAVNGGSSTVKFAIYHAPRPARRIAVAQEGGIPARVLSGTLDRPGAGGATLSWQAADPAETGREVLPDRAAGTAWLLDWLEARPELARVSAVGHRVVHGLERTEPVRITPEVVAELRRAAPYAPDHLPREVELIEAVAARYPDLPQVACFDTAFHRDLPAVARLLPIPRRYQARGVRRYGFHGLSYAYLLEELERIGGQDAARGRVILAHLGNGASLAAVRGGACLDTSMGFTPASGLVSSTRSGDLDPGLVAFLAQREGMTASQFHHMVNHESGLAGVSEISADMRELIAREDEDVRAAEAVALFCYQARKWVGAFTAALGGLDTLVFSAGIGERSALIRARICQGLDFLGLALDEARNAAHAAVISTDASRVAVRVMRTDEELMIARSVSRTLGAGADPVDDYAAR
jgi:acetate kinase